MKRLLICMLAVLAIAPVYAIEWADLMGCTLSNKNMPYNSGPTKITLDEYIFSLPDETLDDAVYGNVTWKVNRSMIQGTYQILNDTPMVINLTLGINGRATDKPLVLTIKNYNQKKQILKAVDSSDKIYVFRVIKPE